MGCSVCGNEKTLASGKKYCKNCQANYQKKHYQNNKKYYKDKARARDKKISDFISSLKKDKPCIDCGVVYPPYVMDFDHREDKKYNISHMARLGLSEDAILLEISKCDLVCSNCHRKRTYARRLVS